MSSNRTEVTNRALVKIGANTITSLLDESEQARKASLVFKSLVQSELRKQAWNFAKARATLAPLAVSVGGQDFKTSYNLPADLLRLITLNGNWVFSSIREVVPGGSPYYAIEGRTLVTNDSGPAYISYVNDVSELTALWDACFVEMIACRMAMDLVHSITKNLPLKQSLKQDYNEALKEAKRTNAIELPPQSIADDSWVQSRYW